MIIIIIIVIIIDYATTSFNRLPAMKLISVLLVIEIAALVHLVDCACNCNVLRHRIEIRSKIHGRYSPVNNAEFCVPNLSAVSEPCCCSTKMRWLFVFCSCCCCFLSQGQP